MTYTHSPILQCDAHGHPQDWIDYEKAAYYYCKDLIAWSIGENGQQIVYGGVSRMTGKQSYLIFDPIIAVKGKRTAPNSRVPLSKRALFRRDQYICGYCGGEFSEQELQMEHVRPRSKGGPTKWENLVSACRSCNSYKEDRTPEQAGMELIYVPYVPNRAEWLILMNRSIIADQMDFLKARVSKQSRIVTGIHKKSDDGSLIEIVPALQ